MRKYLVLFWLLLLLPALVFHFGRGQTWLARDRIHDLAAKAGELERANDWAGANALYQQAAALTAEGDAEPRLRLELAQMRTRHQLGEALTAIDMADKLLSDPDLPAMPAAFQNEVREAAARIHYHAAWVMRLEGASRELWMEEAEQARQNFRLLAETAAPQTPARTSAAPPHQHDLESAVQLQRLSLTELMARPLPPEAQLLSGQGLSEQMSKRRGQRGRQPTPGQGDGPPEPGAGMDRYIPGEGS